MAGIPAKDTPTLKSIIISSEKAPTITTARLKLFFNQRKKIEKEGSTTNVEKGPVIQPDPNPKPKRKRGHVKEKIAETFLEKGESFMELQKVETAYESQKKLHGYLEDVHTRSLWGKLYPFSVMADELCCFPEDMKMIDGVGHVGVSRFLQVIGARIVAVGRAQELALEKESKTALDVAELSSAVEKKEKTIVELSSSLRLKASELAEERRLQLSSNEEVKTTKAENDRLGSRVKELETEVYEAFAQGFERAVSQVRVLFPESDVTKLDATKVVVNGQLMEDEAAAGDDSEESSIGDKAD